MISLKNPYALNTYSDEPNKEIGLYCLFGKKKSGVYIQ